VYDHPQINIFFPSLCKIIKDSSEQIFRSLSKKLRTIVVPANDVHTSGLLFTPSAAQGDGALWTINFLKCGDCVNETHSGIVLGKGVWSLKIVPMGTEGRGLHGSGH
jgi:hypothetical protein